MRLEYSDDGPGPVVVLLHGFPFDRSVWEAQRTSLGSVYRIIAPDLRGHGQSVAPEGPYAIDDMAEDVVELLDALKIDEPVVVGGLSMGGYIALSLAVRHPERLRGLILMDTRAGADTPAAAIQREELARAVEAAGSAEPVVTAMLPRLFSPTTPERRPGVIERVRKAMTRTLPVGVAGALRGMAARPDRTADLARIQVPTLVLVGEHDVITPLEEARTMVAALPNADLVVIPNAGHLAPLENPAPANAAILAFLEKLG